MENQQLIYVINTVFYGNESGSQGEMLVRSNFCGERGDMSSLPFRAYFSGSIADIIEVVYLERNSWKPVCSIIYVYCTGRTREFLDSL